MENGFRIVAVVEALRTHPYLGRAGQVEDVRELVLGGTPCIIVYRVRGDRVVIDALRHGARSRPG